MGEKDREGGRKEGSHKEAEAKERNLYKKDVDQRSKSVTAGERQNYGCQKMVKALSFSIVSSY